MAHQEEMEPMDQEDLMETKDLTVVKEMKENPVHPVRQDVLVVPTSRPLL